MAVRSRPVTRPLPSASMLPAPALAADDLAVVDHARSVVTRTVDAMRPHLLARAGDADSHAKSDGTPVTEADLWADRTLVGAIADAFPDHAVVSEEGGTTFDGTPWTWVIDPIDGTSNFTAGLPYWCLSIALLRDGEPVYGCVDAPALDRRYEAVRGAGATRDGRPIHVRDPVDPFDGRNAHVPVIVTAGTIRHAPTHVRLNARILGAAALDLAMVAEGAAIACYQRVPKVWDVAAGSLLVTEAGGAYLPLGEPLLPPPRGVDLSNRSGPAAAGPEETWLRRLMDALAF